MTHCPERFRERNTKRRRGQKRQVAISSSKSYDTPCLGSFFRAGKTRVLVYDHVIKSAIARSECRFLSLSGISGDSGCKLPTFRLRTGTTLSPAARCAHQNLKRLLAGKKVPQMRCTKTRVLIDQSSAAYRAVDVDLATPRKHESPHKNFRSEIAVYFQPGDAETHLFVWGSWSQVKQRHRL